MTKKRTTKHALILSALSLLLCVSMLVGSTFAWFTDSVTSANNKIVAGNLDVDLYYWTATNASVEITDTTAPIFGAADSVIAQNNNANTLWEPGKTQVAYLSIKNNGTLDLKYKVVLDVQNVAKNLYEVMEYAITPDATYGTVNAWAGNGTSVVPGINDTAANDVVLKKGEEHFFALSIHMDEEAGNPYQNGQVNFDIKVLATQLDSEFDSFGSDYDEDAVYADGITTVPVAAGVATEIEVRNQQGTKIASALVPAEALAENVENITVIIEDSDYDANITVDTGSEKVTYDVTVSGLKANNTTPVKVELRLPAGLDPATVKLYHYDTEIPCTYNPFDGYVTFETTDFSPFTVVYDAESEYVPAEPTSAVPTATVTEYALANTPGYSEDPEVVWGNIGGFSPDYSIDADPKLEAAYQFLCDQTPDEAEASDYANWYCDFFVKLDDDLGANEIFLGGNYGDFGWIGFHNGDMTLGANTPVPLLSLVSAPWTYVDIATYVGDFVCGVGDVDDALSGKTFTVELRLIDPSKVDTSDDEWWAQENLTADKYIVVNSTTHTFVEGEYVTDAEELQNALDNAEDGDTIVLGGDIDLSNGLVIGG